jgi:hypothetical protein
VRQDRSVAGRSSQGHVVEEFGIIEVALLAQGVKFDPFTNDNDSLEIGGLTFENREERISVYGDIDISREKKGLEVAQKIAVLLNSVVERLSSEKLPESIPPAQETDTVKDPFG